MMLDGLEVLCGGPIKALFSNGHFDDGMRVLVTDTIVALRAAGATVNSAHLTEGFSTVAAPSQDVALRDFAWCRSCDVYVALLPTDARGVAYPSAGTAIELGWVSARRVPVVVLWNDAVPTAYSHLVRGLDAVTTVVYLDLARTHARPAMLTDAVARLAGACVARPG